MKQKFYPLVGLFFLLLLWQGVVSVSHAPSFIFPGPVAVLEALFTDREKLLLHSLVTVKEAVIGLCIAGLLAFVSAVVMDRWRLLHQLFYPLLVVSQTLPIMVLGPLLALWFGFGLAPKIILVVLMSYFPILIAFYDRLQKVSNERLLFLKTFGATTFQLYRQLKIPEGMNGFFSGLKVAATYCVGGAVIGEWLSAEAGLGYYMIRVKNGFQINKVFASILCVILLSLLLNFFSTSLQKTYHYFLYKKG